MLDILERKICSYAFIRSLMIIDDWLIMTNSDFDGDMTLGPRCILYCTSKVLYILYVLCVPCHDARPALDPCNLKQQLLTTALLAPLRTQLPSVKPHAVELRDVLHAHLLCCLPTTRRRDLPARVRLFRHVWPTRSLALYLLSWSVNSSPLDVHELRVLEPFGLDA